MPSTKQPNILIIVLDSLRADHVSCHGYDRPTTPCIDRLAREGCVFENTFSAAPFSPASYASIFSNLYPHQHGVNGDTVRVWPDRWPRLPELLQKEGYHTIGLSNNTFLSETMAGTRGFDVFQGPQDSWLARQHSRVSRRIRMHLSDAVADRLVWKSMIYKGKGNSRASLKKVRQDIEASSDPFFAFVVLMDPHAPFHPGRRQFCESTKAARNFHRNVNGPQMWPRMMAHRRTLSPELTQAAKDLYDGEVHYVDGLVGELVESLRVAGRLDNTIVVVTADHGEAFGEDGVWGHGFSLKDFMMHVPLIVRCPQFWEAGTRSDALVQLHDLHETCLHVAQIGKQAENEYEHSLTRAVDASWQGRDLVFSEFPLQTGTMTLFKEMAPGFDPGRWGKPMWSVRSKLWQYIDYENGDVDLFDVMRDPEQVRSVHGEHPDVCREMAEALAKHRSGNLGLLHEASGEVEEEEVDEVVLERLRSLGYIE